jgi:receptor expression-enhancing protein 5/6
MSVSVEASNRKTLWEQIEEQLKLLEEKTGVNSTILLGGLGACLFFVFIGYFDYYITNIVGIVYPAFWSIRAIESRESDDDKQWLTYWVVFSLFSIIDLFSGFILKFIPFYFFFKLLFLIWLFMPNTRGAIFVYDKFLIKMFKKYESQLETLADRVGEKVADFANQGKSFVKDNRGNIISGGMNIAGKVADATNDEKKSN